VRTVGIDLAAEASRTAVATVEWHAGEAVLVDLALGVEDAALLAAIGAADKAGVDCPLGWPDPFVAFLNAHHLGHVPAGASGLDWRRTLSKRATDLHVARVAGVVPMSVSADRIAAVAMRAAGLLGALAAAGTPVDRVDGVVVEAYPAAALKRWGLPHRSYKRAENQPALGALVDALLAALPALHLPAEQDALCRASDDALDAVVCALIARAAALGLTDAPPPELRALADREGWIAVPGCSLRDLLDERVRER
jgi:predicted nuclease with RNAse H fold